MAGTNVDYDITSIQFGEYQTEFDASIGTFPVTVNAGDWFNTTTSGTVDGQAFDVGDLLVAITDAPSTTTYAGNWTIVPHPVGSGPTALSTGTVTGTTYGITSDGSINDIVLPVFNSTQAGLTGSSGGGTTNYLRADGTWASPPGGTASNSFETHTVTDTDSGFTWAAIGSAVASSPTDTLTFVSGNLIDIDVDISNDAIRVTTSANNYVHPNHTGDVTSTGDGVTVIADDAVTYAKMQNVTQTDVVLGRDTAGSGIVEEITPSALRTMLNITDGANVNVTTNLSMGTVDGTQYVINSSDGTNVSLPLADTNNWGIISDEIFDEIAANTLKVTNQPTALSTGTITATTYGITSDGSSDDVILPEANTTQAGLLGADKWDEIVANTLKNTNVPTSLSTGTVTGTTYGVTSDGGADDLVLPVFNSTQAGLTGSSGGGTTNYLRADGTWASPPGGAAPNSFETHTVDDTDTEYTWAAIGSVVADSSADTLTWVSGSGIDIDVDPALDAIRITNTSLNVSTSLSTGTISSTTYGITSDGGTDDVVLVEADTNNAGLLGADKWDEIVANTAKVTNVSTNLSLGTLTATTMDVNSSDGTNVTLIEADTTNAGLLGSDKWDEIVANNAKVTNVSTNLGYTTAASEGTVTSSDGTDATLPAATTSLAGLLTGADKTKLDGIEALATADQTAGEIEAIVDHDNLIGFVANEHIDWTLDQGASNIHAGNYTDTVGISAGYGSIYVESNATLTAFLGSSSNWSNAVQVPVFDTNGASTATTPDHTTDDIEIDTTGVYEVSASLSFFAGTSGTTFSFAIFKNNGATQIGTRVTQTMPTSGEVSTISLIAPAISFTATDTIEVWMQNETGSTDITIADAILSVRRVD